MPAGRKIGVLVTDGTDADLLGEIRQAAGKEQVNVEVVAPAVGGITDSAGQRVPADQKLDAPPPSSTTRWSSFRRLTAPPRSPDNRRPATS